MRIEITDDKVIHDGVVYLRGEVRFVDEAIGRYFCAHGWARDMDGVVPSGMRTPGVAVVHTADVVAEVRRE